MTDPAAKQYYRCANTHNSDISKLIDFSCPLHKKKKFTGNFREAGYMIDISGVALCPDCYARKRQKYIEEIDNINTKYGIMIYNGSLVNHGHDKQNDVHPKEQNRSYYLDNSESNDFRLDHVSSCRQSNKNDNINRLGKNSEMKYKSILTSDISETSDEDRCSDIELSNNISRNKIPKRIINRNQKKTVKRPVM